MSEKSRSMGKYRYFEIVEQIRGMIREGQIAVGDRLPPERALAVQFGVSRNCIRQAVQALTGQGVLESRQGDGTYVRVPDPAALTESLAQAMSMQEGLLREIWEFRLLMEPQIASLAAVRISPEQIDRLKVVAFDQQNKLQDGESAADLDAAFHRIIVEASQNRVIEKVMRTMHEILDQSRGELFQSDARSRASLVGHLQVLDALERRDPDAAFQAMRDHLRAVESLSGAGGAVSRPRSSREVET